MAIEGHVTADDHVYSGEDKELPITVYQADGTTLQDITGWALSWSLKRRKGDTTALITKTTVNGIALTTPLSGLCTVTLTDTDLALSPMSYVHELKRTDDGFETVLVQGRFRLLPGVHA